MKLEHDRFYLTRDGKIVLVKKSKKNHDTNYIFESEKNGIHTSYLDNGSVLCNSIDMDNDLIKEVIQNEN